VYTLGAKVRCEKCNHQLRWIHELRNEQGGITRVGSCCAKRLVYDDAKGAEKNFRDFFKLSKWRVSKQNRSNIWRDARMPDDSVVTVTIFLSNGQYGICLARRRGNDTYFHRTRYNSQSKAMEVAFELLEIGRKELRLAQR